METVLDVGFKIGLIKTDMVPSWVLDIEMDFFLVPDRSLYLVDKDYAIHSAYDIKTSAGREKMEKYRYAFEALRANALILSEPRDITKLAALIREFCMAAR